MKKTFKSVDLCLISQLALGIIVMLIGIVVMVFKTFGLLDINLYISILFYTYALFSTLMYFIRRNEGDYELLLLSLINIITATFMFIFKNDSSSMILGAGMTIYTILIIVNRGVKMLLLKKRDNFMWIIKFLITFLIGFLGILTIFNLFKEVTVPTLMFGYYFICLGFLITIENIVEVFMTDATFRKILSKILNENHKLEEIKETKTVSKKIDKSEKIETPEKVNKPVKKETQKKNEKVKTETKKQSSKNSTKKDTVKKIKENSTSSSKTTKTPKKVGRPKKEDTIKTSSQKK